MSLNEFTENLTASGLMTADQLQEFRAGLPPEHRHLTADALARLLVLNGRLTEYQVQRIRDGRPHGLTLGNYVIQEQIGSGGMGEVFRAQHLRMKRDVVIKILPEDRTQSLTAQKRFQREVEAAAQAAASEHCDGVRCRRIRRDLLSRDGVCAGRGSGFAGQPRGTAAGRERAWIM